MGGEENGYHKPQFRESIFNEKSIWNYHARDNSTYPYLQLSGLLLRIKEEKRRKSKGEWIKTGIQEVQ